MDGKNETSCLRYRGTATCLLRDGRGAGGWRKPSLRA